MTFFIAVRTGLIAVDSGPPVLVQVIMTTVMSATPSGRDHDVAPMQAVFERDKDASVLPDPGAGARLAAVTYASSSREPAEQVGGGDADRRRVVALLYERLNGLT